MPSGQAVKKARCAIFSTETGVTCACSAAGEPCKGTLLCKASEPTAHVAGFGLQSEGTEECARAAWQRNVVMLFRPKAGIAWPCGALGEAQSEPKESTETSHGHGRLRLRPSDTSQGGGYRQSGRAGKFFPPGKAAHLPPKAAFSGRSGCILSLIYAMSVVYQML